MGLNIGSLDRRRATGSIDVRFSWRTCCRRMNEEAWRAATAGRSATSVCCIVEERQKSEAEIQGPVGLMGREAMTDYTCLPVGDGAPGLVNAVIEIPKDSVNKYEYDKELHVFRLDRTLFSPVHYPGDYGFIPCTLGLDGDPLDVLVLVEAPSFPGCLIEVRPIGVLRMVDKGKGDEKILAVANSDPLYREVRDCSQVFEHTLREIEHFFSIYKNLEGKKTAIAGWDSVDAARQIITEGQKRFE
jgi:inorganic pyrophosphatase